MPYDEKHECTKHLKYKSLNTQSLHALENKFVHGTHGTEL